MFKGNPKYCVCDLIIYIQLDSFNLAEEIKFCHNIYSIRFFFLIPVQYIVAF